MKKIIFCLVVFAFTLASPAQAQFLKKLKDKATNVLDKKPVGDNKNTETPKNGSGKIDEAPSSDCVLAFTLEEGERLMFDESSIYISTGIVMGWKFVTYKDGKYFLIDNGVRTGPFDKPPLGSLNNSSGPRGSITGSETIAKKYTKMLNGKPSILFNGKTYGPYFMIMEMAVSEDQQHFFATAIEGSNITSGGVLVSESGKQKLPGMGSQLKVSSNFKFAVCTVMEMSGNGKAYFVSNTGKKTGPYEMLAAMQMGEGWLDDNGNLLSIPSQSPTELLVNGEGVAKFDKEINKDKLIVAGDPSKSVFYEDGIVYKGDGSKVKAGNVLYPHFITINGVLNICWFQMYKNPQTGVKEAYVCKKPV